MKLSRKQTRDEQIAETYLRHLFGPSEDELCALRVEFNQNNIGKYYLNADDDLISDGQLCFSVTAQKAVQPFFYKKNILFKNKRIVEHFVRSFLSLESNEKIRISLMPKFQDFIYYLHTDSLTQKEQQQVDKYKEKYKKELSLITEELLKRTVL
jgi:hypothetical protein